MTRTKSVTAETPCAVEGCDKKRRITSTGVICSYCDEHEKQRQRERPSRGTGEAKRPRTKTVRYTIKMIEAAHQRAMKRQETKHVEQTTQ